MVSVRTYVFVHLSGGPVPAGLLTMTDEPRNQFATFAYGRRYLERPDRIPVDPIALPLHDAGSSQTFQTEEDSPSSTEFAMPRRTVGDSTSCTRRWASGHPTQSI